MNDSEFAYLEGRIDARMADAGNDILGAILLDFAVIPKRSLYPALAKLLGVACECRTLECRGCDDVEEWLQSLEDGDHMIGDIVGSKPND